MSQTVTLTQMTQTSTANHSQPTPPTPTTQSTTPTSTASTTTVIKAALTDCDLVGLLKQYDLKEGNKVAELSTAIGLADQFTSNAALRYLRKQVDDVVADDRKLFMDQYRRACKLNKLRQRLRATFRTWTVWNAVKRYYLTQTLTPKQSAKLKDASDDQAATMLKSWSDRLERDCNIAAIFTKCFGNNNGRIRSIAAVRTWHDIISLIPAYIQRAQEVETVDADNHVQDDVVDDMMPPATEEITTTNNSTRATVGGSKGNPPDDSDDDDLPTAEPVAPSQPRLLFRPTDWEAFFRTTGVSFKASAPKKRANSSSSEGEADVHRAAEKKRRRSEQATNDANESTSEEEDVDADTGESQDSPNAKATQKSRKSHVSTSKGSSEDVDGVLEEHYDILEAGLHCQSTRERILQFMQEIRAELDAVKARAHPGTCN